MDGVFNPTPYEKVAVVVTVRLYRLPAQDPISSPPGNTIAITTAGLLGAGGASIARPPQTLGEAVREAELASVFSFFAQVHVSLKVYCLLLARLLNKFQKTI